MRNNCKQAHTEYGRLQMFGTTPCVTLAMQVNRPGTGWDSQHGGVDIGTSNGRGVNCLF